MEVTTIEGHLLALFVEEPVPCLRGRRRRSRPSTGWAASRHPPPADVAHARHGRAPHPPRHGRRPRRRPFRRYRGDERDACGPPRRAQSETRSTTPSSTWPKSAAATRTSCRRRRRLHGVRRHARHDLRRRSQRGRRGVSARRTRRCGRWARAGGAADLPRDHVDAAGAWAGARRRAASCSGCSPSDEDRARLAVRLVGAGRRQPPRHQPGASTSCAAATTCR